MLAAVFTLPMLLSLRISESTPNSAGTWQAEISGTVNTLKLPCSDHAGGPTPRPTELQETVISDAQFQPQKTDAICYFRGRK